MDLEAQSTEYCKVRGLDPGRTSVEWRPDGYGNMIIMGHRDLGEPTPRPGYALNLAEFDSCCCGTPGCDGGLAERLKAWGIDPAEVSEVRGTFPLGAVDCE
jgi:hypothetical protein